MPLIDMPLKKLKRYRGRNPRPKDFDAFWKRALNEMRSIKLEIEMVRSKFAAPGAECFDLYFTGVRGARLHAKYLRPKNGPKPHPAVVMFHGYTGNSGEWHDKLNLMDTICPPSTQFAAYNKIRSRKKMVIYPDYGHETGPGFLDMAFRFLTGL